MRSFFRLLVGGLYAMLPHATLRRENPLSRVEGRQLPPAPDLARLSLYWALRVAGVMLGLYLVGAAVVLIAPDEAVYRGAFRLVGQSYFVHSLLSQMINLALLISLADKFVLDFAGVIAPLNMISSDMQGGRWDLMLLANLRGSDVIEAKHAAAQARTWRLMCSVAGFRLGVVVIALLNVAVLPLFIPPEAGVISLLRPDGGALLVEAYIFLFLIGIAYIIGGAMYVFEPRWRLRALALAGLGISSRRQGTGSGLFSAFGVVIGVWVAQIVVSILSMCSLWVTSSIFFGDDSGFSGLLAIMYIGLITFFVYMAYSILTNMWRERLLDRLVAMGFARR